MSFSRPDGSLELVNINDGSQLTLSVYELGGALRGIVRRADGRIEGPEDALACEQENKAGIQTDGLLRDFLRDMPQKKSLRADGDTRAAGERTLNAPWDMTLRICIPDDVWEERSLSGEGAQCEVVTLPRPGGVAIPPDRDVWATPMATVGVLGSGFGKWLVENHVGLQVNDELSSAEAAHVQDVTAIRADNIASLASFTRLRSLRTNSVAVEAIGAMPELEQLELVQASVAEISQIGKLKSLRALRIGSSPVDTLARISSCTQLRTLDLGERVDVTALASFAKLRVFRAKTTTGLATFSRFTDLPDLRVIEVGESDITDQVLIQMKPLHELRKIALNSESIGNTGFALLRNFPKLQWLTLTGDFNRKGAPTEVVLAEVATLSDLRTLLLPVSSDPWKSAGLSARSLNVLRPLKELRVLRFAVDLQLDPNGSAKSAACHMLNAQLPHAPCTTRQ